MKTKTVSSLLQKRIDSIVDLNIRDMLDTVVSSTWLEMSEKEKQNFYDQHLKSMRMKVGEDGSVSLVID